MEAQLRQVKKEKPNLRKWKKVFIHIYEVVIVLNVPFFYHFLFLCFLCFLFRIAPGIYILFFGLKLLSSDESVSVTW